MKNPTTGAEPSDRTPLAGSTVVVSELPALAQDAYLSLRALAAYASLSVRTLRALLDHPVHPLPHYRPGGKILVRRGEFDAWMAGFRHVGVLDVEAIVREVLTDPHRSEPFPCAARKASRAP